MTDELNPPSAEEIATVERVMAYVLALAQRDKLAIPSVAISFMPAEKSATSYFPAIWYVSSIGRPADAESLTEALAKFREKYL